MPSSRDLPNIVQHSNTANQFGSVFFFLVVNKKTENVMCCMIYSAHTTFLMCSKEVQPVLVLHEGH